MTDKEAADLLGRLIRESWPAFPSDEIYLALARATSALRDVPPDHRVDL